MARRNDRALSEAQIRYILAIHRLDAEQCGVRCVDIAQALNLTKPTIHSMMKTLNQFGLVDHARGGAVFLTEHGRARARQYADCCATATRLFQAMLNLPEAQAGRIAHSLLTELDFARLEEVEECMQAALSRIG